MKPPYDFDRDARYSAALSKVKRPSTPFLIVMYVLVLVFVVLLLSVDS